MTTVLDAIKVELTISREALLLEVSSVPDAQFDARPSDEVWSVAEILDHLATVERRVGGLLAKTIEGRSDEGVSSIDAEKLISETDRVMREKGAEALKTTMTPSRGLDRGALLDALETTRAQFFRLIDDAHGIDLSTTTFPHPFFGDLNIYQWLVFVSRHEDRHRAQIIRLREAMQPAS